MWEKYKNDGRNNKKEKVMSVKEGFEIGRIKMKEGKRDKQINQKEIVGKEGFVNIFSHLESNNDLKMFTFNNFILDYINKITLFLIEYKPTRITSYPTSKLIKQHCLPDTFQWKIMEGDQKLFFLRCTPIWDLLCNLEIIMVYSHKVHY